MPDDQKPLTSFDRDLRLEIAVHNLWSFTTATEALLLKVLERPLCEMHDDEDFRALEVCLFEIRKWAVEAKNMQSDTTKPSLEREVNPCA
ncbi:MAG: hypothetical protein AAF498_09525 [Pseudomonadota bacterium]